MHHEYWKRSPLLLLLAIYNSWPPQLSRSHHDTKVTNSGSVRAPMLPSDPSIKSVTAADHSRAFGAKHRSQLTIADSDIIPPNEDVLEWFRAVDVEERRRAAARNKHRRCGFGASFSYVMGDTLDRKRSNPNATTHKHATIYHSQITNATIKSHSAQSNNKRNNQCWGKWNKQNNWPGLVRTVPHNTTINHLIVTFIT